MEMNQQKKKKENPHFGNLQQKLVQDLAKL